MDIAFLPTTSSWGGRSDQEKKDAILVVVDYLSSRVCLTPTSSRAKAKELAHLFMVHIVKNFGVPRVIVSDRDPKWTSHIWKTLMTLLHIDNELSTARHQQMDGKCERAIKTIKQMLRPYLTYAGTNWV